MWIFTNKGFISVVTHKKDSDYVIIRAREISVLSWLQEIAKEASLTYHPVEYTPKADYDYRMIAHKLSFSCIMAKIVLGMEYTNFKDSIQNKEYSNLCMNIWVELKAWYSKWSYLKK